MVYEVTVDYVASTTVLVEAECPIDAEDAVYDYLKTERGISSVLQAVQENPNRHWSAFEVADMAAAPGMEPEDAEIRATEEGIR